MLLSWFCVSLREEQEEEEEEEEEETQENKQVCRPSGRRGKARLVVVERERVTLWLLTMPSCPCLALLVSLISWTGISIIALAEEEEEEEEEQAKGKP